MKVETGMITLDGVGHWSCGRDHENLEYPYWVWRVSIEGVKLTTEDYHAMEIGGNGQAVGTEFIAELKEFLPATLPEDYYQFPEHVPGDHTFVQIPLKDFRQPDKALEVLRRRFPLAFEKAEKA